MSEAGGVTLGLASPDDAPAMATTFVAAWRAGYRGVVPDDVIDALDAAEVTTWMNDALAQASMTTTVAVLDGQVCGFTRYGADPHRPARSAGYLAALYVHPGSSGQGVGRLLLDTALEAMAADGRDDVRLQVFATNERARRIYERAGFEVDASVPAEDPSGADARWQSPQVGYRRRGVS